MTFFGLAYWIELRCSKMAKCRCCLCCWSTPGRCSCALLLRASLSLFQHLYILSQYIFLCTFSYLYPCCPSCFGLGLSSHPMIPLFYSLRTSCDFLIAFLLSVSPHPPCSCTIGYHVFSV